MENRLGDGDVLPPVERLSCRQHLVQDDAEGPQVRAAIHRRSLNLLGRHVGHRPQPRVGHGAGFGEEARGEEARLE